MEIKIDTLFFISKDLVRQRCDEIARKMAPIMLRAILRGEDENRKSTTVPSTRLWKAFIINVFF